MEEKKIGFTPEQFVLPIIAGGIALLLTSSFPVGVAIFAAFLMPSIIEIYTVYAKDNPNHLWFKRKLYGWGWTPVTWQGWFVTILYIALVVAFSLTIDEESPVSEVVFTFILPLVLLSIAFIRIAIRKGEKPKWQWGQPPEDESNK